MKILYVEDELSKNIPYLIRLFSKYLGKERVRKLEALDADESGGDSEEIKRLVEETDLIEVEYRFPDALYKILHNHELYALFIVDRNLVESEYYPEEVTRIDPDYGQIHYDEYFESEGDYLFYKLVLIRGADVMNKFYYLTTLSEKKHDIRSHETESLIDMKKFITNNYIKKGSNNGFKRLQQLIDNIKILDIRNENRHYLKILRDNVDEEASRRFLHILYHKDSDRKKNIIHNLELVKNILEKVLTEAAKRLNAPVFFWNDQNRLIMSKFLSWLTLDEAGKRTNYKFGTNSLMKSFLYSIYVVASEFGSRGEHNRKPFGHQATVNTVNALVYALKDIILWFDKICQPVVKKGK